MALISTYTSSVFKTFNSNLLYTEWLATRWERPIFRSQVTAHANHLAQVVQNVDGTNYCQWINLYPADQAIGFVKGLSTG